MRYIYKELKTNSLIAKSCVLIAILSVIGSLVFAYLTNNDANKVLYAINDKGIIVPLSKIKDKTDKIKIVKSAVAYFVSNFYSLDQYNTEENIEKVLWLADEKFKKEVIEDKKRKGYYNRFLQTGTIQKAEVIENSIKISSYDSPYNVEYDVLIESINGTQIEKYVITNTATLLDVNLHYPYNPFGILYTNFLESNLRRYQEN